ncbi:MAG: flippase-like domain-containing protein, partial [Cyanobacteria bacterium REEB65]|nr:flippase-like domain-containing protein [Cyanobacteria bacterium REEB65]
CKAFAWLLFLKRLDVKAGIREILFCFSGGEVAKNLPGGVFFQNYLLNRVMGAHFTYTAGASLALLGLEGVVTFVVLLVLGLPHFPWLRPILGILAGAGVTAIAASYYGALPRRLISWGRAHHSRRVQELAEHLDYLVRALKVLTALRLITPGILLVAGFLVAQAMTLSVVSAQVPMVQLPIVSAFDVLAFSIFIPLVFPFPIQFGFTELSGVAAMIAFGAGHKAAIAAMIAFRVWGVGLSMLLGIAGMLLMPKLLVKTLSPLSLQSTVPIEPSKLL